MMPARMRYPILVETWLYPARGVAPIAVESLDWFTWLQEHPAFTYQEGELRFAVRCEQRAERRYWYAYKRAQGKLFKCYLGRSQDLTLLRLREAARQVRQRLTDAASARGAGSASVCAADDQVPDTSATPAPCTPSPSPGPSRRADAGVPDTDLCTGGCGKNHAAGRVG